MKKKLKKYFIIKKELLYLHNKVKQLKPKHIMTRQEFELRVGIKVIDAEFWKIHEVYMASDNDKDTFCKKWKLVNRARIRKERAAQEAAREVRALKKKAVPIWRELERRYDYWYRPVRDFLVEKESLTLQSLGIDVTDTVASVCDRLRGILS